MKVAALDRRIPGTDLKEGPALASRAPGGTALGERWTAAAPAGWARCCRASG